MYVKFYDNNLKSYTLYVISDNNLLISDNDPIMILQCDMISRKILLNTFKKKGFNNKIDRRLSILHLKLLVFFFDL